ncbi:MAG: hypothetical protein ACLR4Z_17665 [Butyricicoccaceae bacterium]
MKVARQRKKDDSITIENVIGQRYIGCGSSGKNITVHGTPGNGLDRYQRLDARGVRQRAGGGRRHDERGRHHHPHGNVSDACGYGMRGGRIFIEGDCSYRGGIHMKAYLGTSRRRHRRQGRLLHRRISGGRPYPRARHRSEQRVSGQQFLRNRYARRQNCAKDVIKRRPAFPLRSS